MGTDWRTWLWLMLAEQIGCDVERIHPGSLLIDDLGADSLDLVEIVLAIEDKTGVPVADDRAETLQTAGDILAYLESLPARAA
jgi:acyl carrier protein